QQVEAGEMPGDLTAPRLEVADRQEVVGRRPAAGKLAHRPGEGLEVAGGWRLAKDAGPVGDRYFDAAGIDRDEGLGDQGSVEVAGREFENLVPQFLAKPAGRLDRANAFRVDGHFGHRRGR